MRTGISFEVTASDRDRLLGISADRNSPQKLDPHFIAKLHDIVGLYVDPPAHTVVLSVDEKSRIQALDRTQPGLPLNRKRQTPPGPFISTSAPPAALPSFSGP